MAASAVMHRACGTLSRWHCRREDSEERRGNCSWLLCEECRQVFDVRRRRSGSMLDRRKERPC